LYDVTNLESFASLQQWLLETDRYAFQRASRLSKADLEQQEQRRCSRRESPGRRRLGRGKNSNNE
jgi:hypothetical protein